MTSSDHTRKITPELAVAILAEHGEMITIEKAKIVLDFMYELATLAIDVYLGENGDDPI